MKNGMESRVQSAGGINQSRSKLHGGIASRVISLLRHVLTQDSRRYLTPVLLLVLIYSPLSWASYLYSPASFYWIAGDTIRFNTPDAACKHAADVVTAGAYIFHHVDHVLGSNIVEYETGQGRCMGVPAGTSNPPSIYSGLGKSYECASPLYQLDYYDSRQARQAVCYTDKLNAPKNNGSGDCNSPSTPNPTKIGTGNKWLLETDIAEFSLHISFTRYYNSQSNAYGATSLGWGRAHTYARSILSVPTSLTPFNKLVTAQRSDGRAYVFQYGSNWLPDADIPDRLTELKDVNGVRTGWSYTVAADDSVETYSAAGKLLSIADRTGRVQTLVYDLAAASGGDDDPETLDTVTDDTGRALRFSYDTSKRIATVTDPAGGVITYAYDAQSNLVSVQYPDGRTKTYHYNEPTFTAGANLPHALTGITDENGVRYATYQYSADGKAISTAHAAGADLHNLTYNPDGSTTVTDPLGTARTYTFQTLLGVVKSTGQSQPGGSGCGPASSATTYDANGNVASRADFNGNKTCYAYDLARNLETARVEGLAPGTACPTSLTTYTPVAGTAQRKILTDWHATLRVPIKITEAGRETGTVYDTRGNVTSRTIKDLATAKTRTWATTYTYHATVPGVLVKSVDNGPRIDVNDLTTTDYYAPDAPCPSAALLGCRGQVQQITNALGHITTYNEYDAHGRVTKTTDVNALVTTFAYSPRGWLTRRTVGAELTQFDYDNVGQLIKLTRPDASFVRFEYDPAHRLTAIVQQDGGRLTYTLDAMGNRVQENITDPSGYVAYTHRRSFDALGRLWQDIGALNQTITYGYDARGNLKTIDGARTDVADTTSHTYDALDRLTDTLNADGGTEKLTPNALDQTTQVVDPANQTTSHSVNALDDVTQTVSADTGTTIRTYDEAGNLKTERDARGVTVTYTYDALNRLTSKLSSQTGSPFYEYLYDYCGPGRLCYTSKNGILDVYFSYDLQGRAQYRYQNTPTATSNLDYVYSGQLYDAAGRVSQLVYPTGRIVITAYDPQGRISSIATQVAPNAAVTALASNFIYTYPFAGPYNFQYGNGTQYFLNLTQDYRPWFNRDGPRFKILNYDAAGNVSSLWDISNTALTYGYDANGRLTGAIDNAVGSFGSLGFSYDKNGNRLSETRNASVLPYAYSPAGSNWLYQRGSDYRIKNEVGNTASMSGASFTYDGYNRLLTSTTAAETTTYTYNAVGERIKKSNQNGLATTFHYGHNGELLYERDQAGNTKAYVWLDGRPLARIDNNATIYYYHVDHLGTPQAMTNAAGAVVWKADYEPFGKVAIKVSTIENNLRFPGQYFDRETGLYYNYFRTYDPGTGRYGEADPIGLAGGMNLYSYANQNPIMFTDPLGLTPNPFLPEEGAEPPIQMCMGTKPQITPEFPDPPCPPNLDPEEKCQCKYKAAMGNCFAKDSKAEKIICGHKALADRNQCHFNWIDGKK